MIVKQLRKWAIGISLSVASAGGIVYACSDFWEESDAYYYHALPSSFMDSTFRPFFYNFSDFYHAKYSDNGLNDNIDRFAESVVSEWYEYTGGKIPKDVIHDVLNSSDSAENVAPLFKAFNDGKTTYKTIPLQDKRVANFLLFFERANALNAFSTDEIYDWYEAENQEKKQVSANMVKNFLQYYTAASDKDVFLKNRYWFQVTKAYFYAKDYQKLIAFYKDTEKSMPKNTLYYRALSYVAGAHKKLKQTDRANYLFAQVFDRCEALRTVALYNFSPENNADLNASLKLAQNKDEQIAIWAVGGYRGLTTKAIHEIYQLKPNAKYLEMLVASDIDALQRKMANTSFASIKAYQQHRNEHMNTKLYQFVTQTAKAENTSNKGLWYLYASLYALYANDLADANQYIASAKLHYKDEAALKQLKILSHMTTVHGITTIAGNEQQLVKILEWLDKEYENYNKQNYWDENTFESVKSVDIDGNVFSHPMRFVKQYVAKLYQEEKQVVLEELFEPTDGFYKNDKALEAMKTYLKAGPKNVLEAYAIKHYKFNLDDIFYYQGMMALYNNDITKAKTYFAQTKLAKESAFPLNPFNSGIVDCYDCDIEKVKKPSISVMAMVDKMHEMQQKINNNEDVYTNALLLGNAFYNISNYGTGRYFYYQSKILDEYGTYVSDGNKGLLKNSLLPHQYYKLAQKNAILDEQKAKIAYMIAKTERNMYYFNEYDVEGWGYNSKNLPDFKAWNGFKELKQYSNTKFYQQALSDCGYFNQYINK